MCNNSEKFIARSLQQGLYIPHKDPEWEADQQFYNYRWDQQFYNYRLDQQFYNYRWDQQFYNYR